MKKCSDLCRMKTLNMTQKCVRNNLQNYNATKPRTPKSDSMIVNCEAWFGIIGFYLENLESKMERSALQYFFFC